VWAAFHPPVGAGLCRRILSVDAVSVVVDCVLQARRRPLRSYSARVAGQGEAAGESLGKLADVPVSLMQHVVRGAPGVCTPWSRETPMSRRAVPRRRRSSFPVSHVSVTAPH
jgi:hypothetical protein